MSSDTNHSRLYDPRLYDPRVYDPLYRDHTQVEQEQELDEKLYEKDKNDRHTETTCQGSSLPCNKCYKIHNCGCEFCVYLKHLRTMRESLRAKFCTDLEEFWRGKYGNYGKSGNSGKSWRVQSRRERPAEQ